MLARYVGGVGPDRGGECLSGTDITLRVSHHVGTLHPPVKGLGSDSASLPGLALLPAFQQQNEEA